MGVLNPAYSSQGDRPLPVAFGYVMGSGDEVLNVIDPNANQFGFFILADGECDGIEQLGFSAEASFITPTPANPLSPFAHFHGGRWTPIGTDPAPVSVGPEQGFDTFFDPIPTITPAQSLSGMSYVALELPHAIGITSRTIALFTTNLTLAPMMILRAARCRYFDAEGNVTGYGFTTNPVWHRLEAILRYKLKRQQPQIAGLTAAERACFDWPSIVACAARNDFVLSAGQPRFMGNYLFAASGATLGSMIETMCRSDRSYIDTQDGMIGFYGHDAAASSFALSAQHIYAGSFSVAKKDLTKAANVFVPKYRDLNIAAVISVTDANTTDNGVTEGSRTVASGKWMTYFDTGGVSPFAGGQVFYYGDCSNPAMHGDYESWEDVDYTVATPQIMGWSLKYPVSSAAEAPESGTGGYIGTQNSRFAERAPTTVQHRRAQQNVGAVAPGVALQPRVTPVQYDLGNMTYDQANRLMQYELLDSLGADVAGWTAPMTGSVRVRLDAVDSAGNVFARLRPGEQRGIITIGDDISYEHAGEYVITSITINPPSASDRSGSIDVNYKTYNPNAYPDIADAPDDSLRTIASAALQYIGTSQQMPNVAWTLQATPSDGQASDGSVTMICPDLSMQIMGRPTATAYPAAAWTELAAGTAYNFLVTDAGDGTAPTFTAVSPTTPLTAHQYVAFTTTTTMFTGN